MQRGLGHGKTESEVRPMGGFEIRMDPWEVSSSTVEIKPGLE